ncbi:MAG: hypothetical protein MUD05_02135, partial [Candidatus Nanopelagicales bacterium]|nr:hypothetical protein [Candidatus Nanopelagicales bacterium]
SFDAVAVILDGGSETALGSALIYSIVTLAASLAIWWYLRGRAQDSELVLVRKGCCGSTWNCTPTQPGTERFEIRSARLPEDVDRTPDPSAGHPTAPTVEV